MAEKDNLLSAVIESPDDDEPRFRFADWCQRHGDPERGEFIRTQCELCSGPMADDRRTHLQAREQQLLDERGWDWTEEFGQDISEWVYVRGFVERVEMSLEASAEQILSVVRKSPIRHLRDTGQFCDLSGFVAALPSLGKLTGLEFWGLYAFEDDLLRQLLASPHLKHLKTLILHHDRNGNLAEDQLIIEGLNSPCRANLEELAVNVDGMWRGPSNAVLSAIANAPFLGSLRRLNLSCAGDTGNNPELAAATVRRLAASPNLAGLRELDLRGTMARKEVWNAVLEMPQLRNLQKLDLCGASEVTTPWIPIIGNLAKLPHWRAEFERRVRHIDWDNPFIDPWNAGVWHGMSWAQRKRRVLFAMADFVRSRDFDGLERQYHALCSKTSGEAVANQIEQLPFDRWQRGVRPVLADALAIAEKQASDRVCLRLRADIRWEGEFGMHDRNADSDSSPATGHEPFEEYSYSTPQVTRKTPAFEEAAAIFAAHPIHSGTGPSGPALYLIARTVAAFGRCMREFKPPCPVLVSFMWAVFRMA